MKLIQWIATALLTVALAVSCLAQTQDPAAAVKAINDARTKAIADARAANKTINVAELNAQILKMAKEAVAGVDPSKIDGKQGLAWAQLFQMAQMPKEACDCAEAFLATKPEPAQAYAAHTIMLASCNELGEALMLMELIRSIQPPTPVALAGLATSTAFTYSPTIKEKAGLNAALATIRLMEARLLEAAPADDAGKARVRGAQAALAEAKAEMLAEAGRKADALAAVDDTLATLGSAPEARSLRGFRTRMTIEGAAAPAITFERTYGTFAGLEALKGKVVILDFFAHWCGPCIRSFPDMKKLYTDLKDKGLEIVGFTTYYGYYKTENTAKRDMPKDTEFAKMGEFIQEHQLPWPVVYGERTNFDAYGVTGIPHVALIDRKGIVRHTKVGYSPQTFGAFRAEVEKLIAE